MKTKQAITSDPFAPVKNSTTSDSLRHDLAALKLYQRAERAIRNMIDMDEISHLSHLNLNKDEWVPAWGISSAMGVRLSDPDAQDRIKRMQYWSKIRAHALSSLAQNKTLVLDDKDRIDVQKLKDALRVFEFDLLERLADLMYNHLYMHDPKSAEYKKPPLFYSKESFEDFPEDVVKNMVVVVDTPVVSPRPVYVQREDKEKAPVKELQKIARELAACKERLESLVRAW